jgi:hypothetical protein
MLIYLQWLLCWSLISPFVALIEYNIGALCNPSLVGGITGKVDCKVTPQVPRDWGPLQPHVTVTLATVRSGCV